jgi:hypothetical protein
MTLLLSELNASTNREIWFTALKSSGPTFAVEGMARGGRKGVDAYFEKLKSDPAFSEVKLEDSKEDPGQGAGIFVFKVSGKLAGFEAAQAPAAPAPAGAAPPARWSSA